MTKLEPYKTVENALQSLDNGGRFYNMLTKAKDGVIKLAELGKVGGIFNDKQMMILFLELSTSILNQADKNTLHSKLDNDLQKIYRKYKPQQLLPSEAATEGVLSANAIITGIPKLIDSKSDFTGFIMIPIIIGNVTTFTMIPLMDNYDVYELRDDESAKTFLIAHSKDSKKLPHRKIIIGGILKELKSTKDERNATNIFLEVVYYIEN